MITNLDSEGYIRLVDSVASDYRVIKTLGKNKTDLIERKWLDEIE